MKGKWFGWVAGKLRFNICIYEFSGNISLISGRDIYMNKGRMLP